MPSDPPTAKGRLWSPEALIVSALAIALVIAGWGFRHALNPDAVAYLRIAGYYAEGNTQFAVSGYWSPMISWLIALFLKAGLAPLVAARVVMGLSAMAFVAGGLWLFRQFTLSRHAILLGAGLSAIVSVPWSVENITPDLLVAALIAAAIGFMVNLRWPASVGWAFAAGVLWGIAFLCKSVALPLGVVVTVAVAVFWIRTRGLTAHVVWRSGLSCVAGMLVVAGPWITILSRHYGAFTIANSAAMNHCLVGPGVENPRYLLDQGFRVPEAGRVTVWEDPVLPYPDWSPVASWQNARHQLAVVIRNLPVVLLMLTGISLAFPALMAAGLWPGGTPVRKGGPNETWALWPVCLLGLMYLPNHLLLSEQRYFFSAFPLMYIAAATHLETRARISVSGCSRSLLLAVLFLAPTLTRTAFYLNASRTAGECAEMLANRISRSGLTGPIAGSGRLAGGRTGLYVAFLLGQPWHGDVGNPTPAQFKSSGAELILVIRRGGQARDLVAHPDFRNLDDRLFDTDTAAEQFPLQVFQVRR